MRANYQILNSCKGKIRHRREFVNGFGCRIMEIVLGDNSGWRKLSRPAGAVSRKCRMLTLCRVSALCIDVQNTLSHKPFIL
jgi:hypothetical protein